MIVSAYWRIRLPPSRPVKMPCGMPMILRPTRRGSAPVKSAVSLGRASCTWRPSPPRATCLFVGCVRRLDPTFTVARWAWPNRSCRARRQSGAWCVAGKASVFLVPRSVVPSPSISCRRPKFWRAKLAQASTLWMSTVDARSTSYTIKVRARLSWTMPRSWAASCVACPRH